MRCGQPAGRSPAGRPLAALQQRFPSGPRCPLSKWGFPLLAQCREDAEAVERCIQTAEPLQHAGKEVQPSAGELVFIELDFDPATARKAHPEFPDDAGMVRSAADAPDALYLALRRRGIGEVMEPEQLLQRLGTSVDQREVVEGELRDEAP